MLVDRWANEGNQHEEANDTYAHHCANITPQPPQRFSQRGRCFPLLLQLLFRYSRCDSCGISYLTCQVCSLRCWWNDGRAREQSPWRGTFRLWFFHLHVPVSYSALMRGSTTV